MSQDPSTTNASQVPRQPAAHPARSTELASLKIRIRAALRQFPDFPSPGILFEDILPIFADPSLHEALLRCLELHILSVCGEQKPDVVVGLEARGFLVGPSLALRLGAGFVPARKKGKMPGPCETQAFDKEYGQDFFQMQAGSVRPGQKVIVVDDIIATGTSSGRLGLLMTDDYRRLCLRRRRARQENGRRFVGLCLHHGTRVPQGPREAGGAGVHASFGAGGKALTLPRYDCSRVMVRWSCMV